LARSLLGTARLRSGRNNSKIDDRLQTLQIVAFRGKLLQPPVDVEKPRIATHREIPAPVLVRESELRRFGEVSRGVRLIAACRSATDRKTPRLSLRFVRVAKKPSAALSQETDVVELPSRTTFEPSADVGMLMDGAIVDDGVDRLARGNLLLNDIEEAKELLMAMTLHVAADHLAVENVHRGEQGRRS
jgi:hypothetical protein